MEGDPVQNKMMIETWVRYTHLEKKAAETRQRRIDKALSELREGRN
jgi:uncharacterized protein YmfQ (DUF2313 family)